MPLFNADCFEFLPTLEDESVDLTFTSPPYFNAKDYSQFHSYDCFLTWLGEAFQLIYDKTKAGRFCVVNVSPVFTKRTSPAVQSKRHNIPAHLSVLLEEQGWEWVDEIVWLKPEGAAKNRNGNFYQIRLPLTYKPNLVNESVLVFQKGGVLNRQTLRKIPTEVKEASLVPDGYDRTNVWKVNPDTSNTHPAPFPLALAEKVVRYYSFVGDVVLDPFAGSGTTGVACKNLNREFVGVEKDETYFRLAGERLA